MLRICLFFYTFELKYAYKLYAYKKECNEHKEWINKKIYYKIIKYIASDAWDRVKFTSVAICI